MKKKILIVEDDIGLSNGIAIALRSDNKEIEKVGNLNKARELMKEKDFDLILLDLNLPDGHGFDLLEEIRELSSVPIIILTANDLEVDIVAELELGANDYVTKPFSLMVLRARVNANLREKNHKKDLYNFENFFFDFDAMEYKKGEDVLELSKTEQKLLKFLIKNKGNTMTREVLMDKIWTETYDYVDENALSVTVKRLRNKIEDNPSKPKYIKTIYGIGYCWVVK